MTLNIREVNDTDFVDICHENNISIPIEQLPQWDNFNLKSGHKLWKKLIITDDTNNKFIAAISLTEYQTHNFRYLWAKNAPLYAEKPDTDTERKVATILKEYVRTHDKKIVLLRLNITDDSLTKPVMRYIPYDETVIINTIGDGEEILSRMKPRGRRDVRKALRETGMECCEESKTILDNFDEVYAIMVETAKRDGFVPHEAEVYKSMIKILGDNCKFFVGRIDGKAVCWALITIADGVATQYYAATNSQARKIRCHDHLVYFMCNYFSENNIPFFDLMGIGSEFSPSLMGLNGFKTKFSKETTKVAPMRDIVCNSGLYFTLSTLRKINQIIRKIMSR